MPTNLYGPGDNHHPENSHVVPALIRRLHEARAAGAGEVALWGTGTPRREFLYVDHMAAAAVHVMNLDRETYWRLAEPMRSHINIGSGSDVSIRELADRIAVVVGFSGQILFDTSRPDGAPRKLMDSSRAGTLGWRPVVPLEEGLKRAYADFLEREKC